MKTFLVLLLTVCSFQVRAAQFKYNELMLKDYDEMLHLVQVQLKKARSLAPGPGKEDGDERAAIEQLREAVKLILSRPDSDNMVSKLMPEVRKELTGYNAYEDVLSGLTAEEVSVIKDKKAATGPQATATFVIENLIALLKTEAVNNAELRRILDRIRSADIEVPKSVKNDFKLRGMFKTPDPSKTAKEVLKSLPPLKAAH